MMQLGAVRLKREHAPAVFGSRPISLSGTQGRKRAILGAEELIEMGQASSTSSQRPVLITAEEGQLMINVVEALISFSQDYPIEFHSYCPTDRWQAALTDVGTWVHEIQRQITAGATTVTVPAHAVFEMIDLEKCISAARDARLSSAKAAFTLSALGAIADVVFGITWLGVPMYILGLGLLLGRPLLAKFSATPQDPYKPSLSGERMLSGRFRRFCLGGEGCEIIAMKLKKDAETDSFKRQVLERVIVSPFSKVERHHWGWVRPRIGGEQDAVFLAKDRFRVRVEGWKGDEVVPSNGWDFTTDEDCKGGINLSVFETGVGDRQTNYGPVNMDSGHEGNYWVEYTGPLTDGRIRRAGPFGCTGDPVDHAMEDAGFTEAGKDGGYVIFDSSGKVVSEGIGDE
jgi:hypothetical protein